MGEELLAFFAIVILYLAYYYYFKPKRMIKQYSDQFLAKGYKVYKFDFKPFRAPLF